MSTTAPTVLVIFGISGDLAKHKLLPALAHLDQIGKLHDEFRIIGTSRSGQDASSFVTDALGDTPTETRERFTKRFSFIKLDAGDADEQRRLRSLLDELDAASDRPYTKLFYLSVPPTVTEKVIRSLSTAGLCKEVSAPTRLLAEKPFGRDLDSAMALNKTVLEAFDETQVFRIDHYLSKETARNISVFRFHNPIISRLWHGEEIERIEVIAHEEQGVESRARFYEQTGALRDVIQSHLLNLAAVVMMEEPDLDDAESLQQARLDLLDSIVPIRKDEVERRTRRSQYDDYREEVGNPDSNTETFVRIELSVDNTRWKGTELILETGKRMPRKRTEVRILFRGMTRHREDRNELVFRLHPKEGIELSLEIRQPGLGTDVQPVIMDFVYPGSEEGGSPDGYERVLMEAIEGDRSNFISGPEVIRSWEIVNDILSQWSSRQMDAASDR